MKGLFDNAGFCYLVSNNERISVRITEINTYYGEAPEFRGHFCDLEYARGGVIPVEKSPIKNVIFNDPATVVIWNDGSKTVVKCQPGDTYSKETGLALCIAKKYLGNKGNFNEVFKKWIPEETEPVEEDGYIFEEYDEPVEEDVETGAVNLKVSGAIKVGDTVRVVDPGDHYSTYSDWIELHVKNPGDVAKWGMKHNKYIYTGDLGVVKYIAPHEWLVDGDLAYVEIKGYCFIIGVNGLEKVNEEV